MQAMTAWISAPHTVTLLISRHRAMQSPSAEQCSSLVRSQIAAQLLACPAAIAALAVVVRAARLGEGVAVRLRSVESLRSQATAMHEPIATSSTSTLILTI